MNREAESSQMRPLAKAVTKTIETVRNLLREQVSSVMLVMVMVSETDWVMGIHF